MKPIILSLALLTGCATPVPIEPLPDGAEASGAAVGSVAFWRWAGRAALKLISNTTVNIDVGDSK